MFPSLLPTYSRKPLRFERGEGCWLIDDQGERYLDLCAGIAVNALGHAHPALVQALQEQGEKLWHVSNLYEIPRQQELADLLVSHSFADTVFFTNSGTEACELAVKMARKFFFEKGTPRSEIITLEGGFHGRSGAAIAASGSDKMTKGFEPLAPGFRQIAWQDRKSLPEAISPHTCAVLVEPIQGEGGISELEDQLLKELRSACETHGALLILDEVQCGMGRTGRLFAHEWAGIEPDIMMVAKGIGGGFPLGAVLATEDAAGGMGLGTHGSTYGGNPLACAVGKQVIEIIADPEFLEGIRRKAGQFRQSLEGLVASHPDLFEEVRGMGLMLGIKLRPSKLNEFIQSAEAEKLLTVPAADNVVRLLPPLTIDEDELSEAVLRLDRAATRLQLKGSDEAMAGQHA